MAATPEQSYVVLRHYWCPASSLTYERSLTISGESISDTVYSRLRRDMVRCTADFCQWRERIDLIKPVCNNRLLAHFYKGKDALCTYNLFGQNYSEVPFCSNVKYDSAFPESQRDAIRCMPLLVPYGPVQRGFKWSINDSGDFLEFELLKQIATNNEDVVVVRSIGHLTTSWVLCDTKRRFTQVNVSLERTGLVTLAPHGSLILENTTVDKVVTIGENQRGLHQYFDDLHITEHWALKHSNL